MRHFLAKLAVVAVLATPLAGLLPLAASAAGPAQVNLLSAGNFSLLSSAGITNTGSHSTIVAGNVGASPITAASMNSVFCSEITGTIYGVDAAYVGSGSQTCFAGNPPLANKTLVDNAVGDMNTAYIDAAGRTLPDGIDLYSGNLGGQTLTPGLYKWNTDVTIPTSVILSGSATDVWIFQISGNLNVASSGSVPTGVKVILLGGANASNIFWQVGGSIGATLGTYATFNGNILSAKQVIIQTGAVLNGRALAQTQITLDANTISVPPSSVAPQTCATINLASGTSTKTAGFTETTQNSPVTALLPASYSVGSLAPATVTLPVIPPWVDPSLDANFTGTGALWTSTHATWPGGSGNVEGLPSSDQWRLFEDNFNLPVGATVTSANLSFSGDNAVDVYLNGNTTPVATTNNTYGAVPGALPQNFASSFNTPFVPVIGNNALDFVLRNWGGDYSSNPTGLLYKATINYCVPTPPASVQVHIYKYIDGVHATSLPASANGASFPMLTSYSDPNVGAGTNVPFTLNQNGWTTGDLPYEASTGPRTLGSSASFSEDTTTALVGAICTLGTKYALEGYSVGTTLAEAVASPATASSPSFSSLATDEYVIVRNTSCPVTPPTSLKVHILKYLNGQKATLATANNYQFPMTATWSAQNIGAGSGSYVLGTNFGGAVDVYGADTSTMTAPANYVTAEVTDNTSQVVAMPEACLPGKYLLNGYRSSAVSFLDAVTQPLQLVSPSFTNLLSDEYIIVDNASCPTTGSLTVQKDTIGGNGTFSFNGDGGVGAFQITTTSNTGSKTFTNLTPGTYHIVESVQAKWTQTDTECASVVVVAGASPTCVITNANNKLLGEIRGTKYEDRDGDGKLKDGDHHKLSGWTIFLDTNNNGVLDTGEMSTVTNSHGEYHFSGLIAGSYHVREVGQTGWMQTYPTSGKYDIMLASGQLAKKKDFGNFKFGSISGMKFNDANANGKKDIMEVGLAGWTINLKGPNGFMATMVTDLNGSYTFENLGPGKYMLSEVMQNTWTQTMHPNWVKVQSGTTSINNNFGNTQKVLNLRWHENDRDNDEDYNFRKRN